MGVSLDNIFGADAPVKAPGGKASLDDIFAGGQSAAPKAESKPTLSLPNGGKLTMPDTSGMFQKSAAVLQKTTDPIFQSLVKNPPKSAPAPSPSPEEYVNPFAGPLDKLADIFGTNKPMVQPGSTLEKLVTQGQAAAAQVTGAVRAGVSPVVKMTTSQAKGMLPQDDAYKAGARSINYGDVANLLPKMIVMSGLPNAALDIAEGVEANTIGQAGGEVKFPSFNNDPIQANGIQTEYENRIKAGESDSKAFWSSALSLGVDMSLLVPLARGIAKTGVKGITPETLVKSQKFDTDALKKWLQTGEPIPKDLQKAFTDLPTSMKAKVARGIVTEVKVPEPSTLGRILGVSKEEAIDILKRNAVPVPKAPLSELPKGTFDEVLTHEIKDGLAKHPEPVVRQELETQHGITPEAAQQAINHVKGLKTPAEETAIHNEVLARVSPENAPGGINTLHRELSKAYEGVETDPLKDLAKELEIAPDKLPEWVPEELRSKELFGAVFDGKFSIENLQYPAGNKPAARRLYNILLDHADGVSGIDTSAIRDKILTHYGEGKQQRGVTGSGSGSPDGSKRGTASRTKKKKHVVVKPSPEGFKGFPDVTTTVLDQLVGHTTVSKQFISDLAKGDGLKQSERELIRRALSEEGEEVNVKEFADKLKAELLPLSPSHLKDGRYENISLPDELRGPVADYTERIYSSPIKTSAGDVHYSGDYPNANYFAHTRIEDLANPPKSGKTYDEIQTMLDDFKKYPADSKERADLRKQQETANDYQHGDASAGSDTRRVIELQSDLFQKGRLEEEIAAAERAGDKKHADELRSLLIYRNIWHERAIREEIKQAAIDGKTKLQFPTGETAMKIEGLGDSTVWSADNASDITPGELEVGKEIYRGSREMGTDEGDAWVITDVLGDGKFKAVRKDAVYGKEDKFESDSTLPNGDKYLSSLTETFDISGKVDTENPIYKFYEKTVAKYLKTNYDAVPVTDAQGVTWNEVPIDPKYAKAPVNAFQSTKKAPVSPTPPPPPAPDIPPSIENTDFHVPKLTERIEEHLKETFEDVPQYEGMNMKEQANMANDLIIKDYEHAKRVAMGLEAPPEDFKTLRVGSVFKAVEMKAIEDGDKETLRSLALSKTTKVASSYGQEIKAFDGRDPYSPVSAIADLAEIREKQAARRIKGMTVKEVKEKTVKEIKESIKKTAVPKETWESFVDSISC